MIAGVDIVFEGYGGSHAQMLDDTVRAIRRNWRDAVFQDAASGTYLQSYSELAFGRLSELFVYRDHAAFENWSRNGGTEANWHTMVHVIVDSGDVTVVVDDPEDRATRSILDDIESLFSGGTAWETAA